GRPLCTASSLQKSLLPNLSTLVFRTIHFLAFFYIKCFVEWFEITQRTIGTPDTGRVRVHFNELHRVLRTSHSSPYLRPAQEEPLVWCKAIYHLIALTLLSFLECLISNSQSTQICYILTQGQLAIYTH